MATTRRSSSPSPRTPRIDAKTFKRTFERIADNVQTVIKGKEDIVRLALVAILCEGHILFEDLPGTGKTMLARAIAGSMNARDARISCTPDMLPADITGSSVFDAKRGTFEFRPGPVFANVLLVDEINRATPKTQSALLEAMQERRISADNVVYPLPRPFFVLATQNPVELAGTFPLPEAQVDRFLFKLQMGYLSRDREYEVMFDNRVRLQIESLEAVVDVGVVQALIDYAATVTAAPEIGYYIVDLVQSTRTDHAVAMGASARAAIALLRAAGALAASDGRETVFPDDVREVLKPVLAHRVVLNPDALLRGESIDAVLERVTSAVKPPMGGSGGRQ
jgi:MoxR-like ATPase